MAGKGKKKMPVKKYASGRSTRYGQMAKKGKANSMKSRKR